MLTAWWFEDYIVGTNREFGEIIVTESAIVEFARLYDPQLFHLDRGAAQESVFQGLIASGWHTASMTMRLLVDHYLSPQSSLGSPGVDKLRWLVPVRPNDQLSVSATVINARPSKSRPNQGIVRSQIKTLKQNKVVVMEFSALMMIRCRKAG